MNQPVGNNQLLSSVRARIAAHPCVPGSTYRLQFHAGFTLEDATKITRYLDALGVTHAYASPYLTARPGSTHGYDVIDHNHINPELKPDHYEPWLASLKEHDMGHILDIVPNHMGVATNDNGWWNDVLENGPSARHGKHFDIDWESAPRESLRGKVLIATLGEPYARVLEQGQLKLSRDGGSLFVSYYDRRFPIAPATYPMVLGHRIETLAGQLGPRESLAAFKKLIDGFATLPEDLSAREKMVTELKAQLASLCDDNGVLCKFVDQNITAFSGRPVDAKSFDLLDKLLSAQFYRLAYWRVAADEINYRRFFDVSELAAVAMEREEVFEESHRFVLSLLASGKLQGLRLDHPDGLYDPEQYFLRLQRAHVRESALQDAPRYEGFSKADPNALREQLKKTIDAEPVRGRPLYVLGEKILAMEEPLPTDWPIDGTSGYDFLIHVNSLFVDHENEHAFTKLYGEFSGETRDIATISYESKLRIMDTSLASELNMLTRQLDQIAQRDRASRDFTLTGLKTALREIIARFDVYRTYITDGPITPRDQKCVEGATQRAIAGAPAIDPSLFNFVRDTILRAAPADAESKRLQVRFAGKFQQLTSPVTAKGIEDTAFYRYHRLISLNEVGGEPARFGIEPDTLHAYFAERQSHWPLALSTLSTHDTKRSEDVRARLNVLSEIPEDWAEHVQRWRRMNSALGLDVHPNDQYLLFQTLLGAWPLHEEPDFAARIKAYMTKALREGKQRTDWLRPDDAYEKQVHDLVDGMLDPLRSRDFLYAFRPFQQRISRLGMFNSLSQSVLKLLAPGVPDTYQGTELWDYSLVDPDNRRPVDYAKRTELLRQIEEERDFAKLAPASLKTLEDGRAKLLIHTESLRFRRENRELMHRGQYVPLQVAGPHARQVFAFARVHEKQAVVVIVPRLVASILGSAAAPVGRDVWGATAVQLPAQLAEMKLRDLYTGKESTAGKQILVAEALATFPVAALTTAERA